VSTLDGSQGWSTDVSGGATATIAGGNLVFIDPNYDSAPDPTFASGQWVSWDGLANTVVYRSPYANHDWNELIGAHGDEIIANVSIANGQDSRAAGTTSYLDNVELAG
jgi:hypothetical protein